MAANGTPIMWLDSEGLHVCDRIGYGRRWFDGCGCCSNEIAIVSRSRHAPDCPFAVAMLASWLAYQIYLERAPCSDTAPLTAVVPMSPVFDPTLASETATPTTYQLALEVFAAATLAMIDDACPLSGDDWVIPHETVEIWKKARHALALATPTGSDDT